ncbi:AraC family transcriptional regulator [Brooklawnia cerclae]|uniref:AraC-like DNA-binding protein n=1 Tax=Brooklawnia cerclae TaxID=349934 RepID=A0ABX0SIL6_9ACTN|nr:AraC family transcriptional regulator [Brooklawnia cerclae]NIH58234.1 AraC-like DNA-binding protein [Brooklawnia cerclae]
MMQRRAVIVNTLISNRFEIYHVDHAVVEHASLHYHDFHEINCVLEGTGVFHLGGNEYPTEPGTVTLVHRNDLHNIVKQSSAYYERAYVHVREEFLAARSTGRSDLNACFAKNGKPASHVIRVDPTWLRSQITRLDEHQEDDFGSDLLYENHFIEFMILLNQAFLGSDKDVVPYNRPVSSLVAAVMDHVGDNLDADLSLDTIAKAFFVNKYYLSREFKKSTGLNLHEYTLKKRLLHSKDLLTAYGSAQSVYRMCGFSSYTHFLRCFKQEFDMTTKEFIRRSRNPDIVHFTDIGPDADPGTPRPDETSTR